MYKIGIITASDKGSAGLRQDESGPLIKQIMSNAGYNIVKSIIVEDDIDRISEAIIKFTDIEGCDLVLTTGGTGFSLRDVTPEATLKTIERQTPGISEAIRYMSLAKTSRAMLSRGVSGIRGKCLIINLPGSPKAVKECLEFILEPLKHGLDILTGSDSDCATPQ